MTTNLLLFFVQGEAEALQREEGLEAGSDLDRGRLGCCHGGHLRGREGREGKGTEHWHRERNLFLCDLKIIVFFSSSLIMGKNRGRILTFKI